MLDVVVPGVDTPPAAQLCLACRVSLACVTAKVAIAPIPQLLALSVREFDVNKLSLHCACAAATAANYFAKCFRLRAIND
jgi:hypothetical protein